MKKILAIILVVLVLLVSCGTSTEQKKKATKAEKAKQQKEYVAAFKVGVLPTIDGLPLFVAKEKHLFDAFHVDVRLVPFTAQMDCDTAIVGKSVEGIVSDLIRTERLKRKGVALFYPIATQLQWQLISNKTARIKELNQLGDKMVAMTRYSATDYLTDKSLKGVKTTAKVFRVQINDVLVRLQMLLNNEMDAMWLAEPQATTARLHKHSVLAESSDMGCNLGVIAFRMDIKKNANRKKQMDAFVLAYNRAVDSLNIHGIQHYAKIINKYCHTDDKTVEALPTIKFEHAASPLQKDVAIAQRYVRSL